jgi:hypothetical protein
MTANVTRRWLGFGVGLLAFLAVHLAESLMWNIWFGDAHEPWFLNSGRAVAATIGWLFVVSAIAGSFGLSGLMLSAGAFVAMTGVLFLKPGGPGNIFPIVMAFGGLLILGSNTLGAWAGWEIREASRRKR